MNSLFGLSIDVLFWDIFRSAAASQKYFMAINPANGELYISLSQMLRVIRVTSLSNPQDIASNFVSAVGSGQQCIPRAGIFSCGENVAATAASMIFPKGIAFDRTGSLYVADGGAIRLVDQAGIIKTLIPHTAYSVAWSPAPVCGVMVELSKTTLKWPTSLAVNPVDDSLSIVDDNMLLRLSRNRKMVEVVAGSSVKCSNVGGELNGPLAVAVSPSGITYLTEGSAESWTIRMFSGDSNEVIVSSCNCTGPVCAGCLPTKKGAERMQMPVSLAVGTDDVLYVADMKALKVFAVTPSVPVLNAKMEFDIEAPQAGELYSFNR